MRFSFHGQTDHRTFAWFADGLRRALENHGHAFVEATDEASLVINFFPEASPRWFRRNGQAVFVTGVTRIDGPFERPLEHGYPLLVKSLSNLLIALVGGEAEAHFLTPEQGHYVVRGGGTISAAGEGFFEAVYERLSPLACSTLVVDNVLVPDLPEALWGGDEATESIRRAGRRLAAMELLPAPFPITDVLEPEVIRHLQRLFGIGGLSYGNLSARRDGHSFWMSASGVDKSRLEMVGRDILLVTGYDRARGAMTLSVPPGVTSRRVSVDAIEHWMIYREHPEVGAILHVHGWMEGIPCTAFNYPCGTYELAGAVADMVREAEDPARAVVGLKNHGLTITGRSLDEIFERTEGRILRSVPMG
ncbi:MAG: class II aldolase/adducin family protein [Gemmatimonadota bacterium]|jgi:ribulose-5-phosphate 4-epimerase/fuculose-1-phosphate aldolase|nr:MAG: class II aldolase/adducin family protein [Gemmatimonadota bacterium]